jgi:lysine biosynthesis protein LysW
MKSKKRVECPTCRNSFHLENWVKIGHQILCPHCEEMLEVVSQKPITLECVYASEFADIEEQDWLMDFSER